VASAVYYRGNAIVATIKEDGPFVPYSKDTRFVLVPKVIPSPKLSVFERIWRAVCDFFLKPYWAASWGNFNQNIKAALLLSEITNLHTEENKFFLTMQKILLGQQGKHLFTLYHVGLTKHLFTLENFYSFPYSEVLAQINQLKELLAPKPISPDTPD
jgi:hypothetical protein